MAIYHFSMRHIGRNAGRSSTAAAAYRAGMEIVDERTGEQHDYTRKQGVLDHAVLTPSRAPEWARESASLWNAVEKFEKRKDARVSREVIVALPHELTLEQNRDLLHGYVQAAFIKRGMAAQIDIHAPDREGDKRNIHAHIMLTPRQITRNGFREKKPEAWNKKAQLKEWREQWADHMNRALERAGHKERVDSRSFKDQGIEDQEPTRHNGPAVTAMERRGIETDRGEHNRRAKEQNRELAALKKEARVIDLEIEREKRRAAAEKEKEESERDREHKRSSHKLSETQDRIGQEIEKLAAAQEREESERDREHKRSSHKLSETQDRIRQEMEKLAAAQEEKTAKKPAPLEYWDREAYETGQQDKMEQAAVDFANAQEKEEREREQQRRELRKQQRAAARRRQWEKDIWASKERNKLQSRQHDEQGALERELALDMDNAKEKLDAAYSDNEKKWRADLQEIKERQEKGGPWYKWRHANDDLEEAAKKQRSLENSIALREQNMKLVKMKHDTRRELLAEAQAQERAKLEQQIKQGPPAQRPKLTKEEFQKQLREIEQRREKERQQSRGRGGGRERER